LKQKFVVLLALILCVSLLMTGCTTDKDQGEKPSDAGSSDLGKLDVTICGGSIGGAWAAIGEGVCEVIRRSNPGANAAYEVGQEAANIALVASGKVSMGIAHTGLLKLAAGGEAPFDRKMDNLKAITVLYSEAAEHFIIRQDTGITSFDDLRDNEYPLKLNLNTKDSFMEIVGRETLAAHGITYDDIASWGGKVDFMSMGPSLDLMRDGKLDAFSNVIQVPSSHVLDASTSLKLTLLPTSDQGIKQVNDKLGTYETIIPVDEYPFLKEPVPTVAATVILFASADMKDEEAYAVVKSIDENMDYFRGIHASLKELRLEDMVKVSPVALHPGAEKYYREKGAL